MITLYLKSIDAQNQPRSFQCILPQLESVLGTLSLIAASGSVFVEIYMVEDGQRTNLAPQAFDGQDMAKPIRALQAQWETVLAQPRQPAFPAQSLILLEIVLQRIDHFETLMGMYKGNIVKLEGIIGRAQEQLCASSRKHQLLIHYDQIINQQYRFMGQAQTDRDKCLQKLTELKSAYLK